jgi:hypothetical protein
MKRLYLRTATQLFGAADGWTFDGGCNYESTVESAIGKDRLNRNR